MKYRSKTLLALGAATALALTACGGGGGGGDEPAVTAQVPASASASTAGFMSYLQALLAATDDSLEPVDASGVTPPNDENSDPLVWS